MIARQSVFRLARAAGVMYVTSLPSYSVNIGVVAFLTWYFDWAGLSNLPFVLIGDATGFLSGMLLVYFVFQKSARLRRWTGSNEKTKCPHCGQEL